MQKATQNTKKVSKYFELIENIFTKIMFLKKKLAKQIVSFDS